MREPASRRRRNKKRMSQEAFTEKNTNSDLPLKLFSTMQKDATHPEQSQLASVLLTWISEADLDASRSYLEEHPALVDDTGVQVLEELLVAALLAGDAETTRQLQMYRNIVAAIRDMGVEATYAELARSMTSAPTETLPPEVQSLLNRLGGLSRPEDMPARVALLEQALGLVSHEEYPLSWAELHSILGSALLQIPADDERARLELALSHYDDALSEQRRERATEAWAITQHNKGIALTSLAKLVQDEERLSRLKEALVCFDNALLERRQEVAPDKWAMTRYSQGDALSNMAQLLVGESQEQALQQGIACYDDAMTIYEYETAPVIWAAMQRDKADMLVHLARLLNEDVKIFREAISCYDNALRVYQRETDPVRWADVQINKGTAMDDLADRLEDEERVEVLRQAIACYDSALLEYSRERRPDHWAALQTNKASTLGSLARQQSGEMRAQTLREAIACSDAALLEYRREVNPGEWARAQQNKGIALRNLARVVDSEQQAQILHEALVCFDNALLEDNRAAAPDDWAKVQHNKGNTLLNMADLLHGEQRVRTLQEALTCFNDAQTATRREDMLDEWAMTQQGKADTLSALALAESGEARIALLREALLCYDAALDETLCHAAPNVWAMIQNNKAGMLSRLVETQKQRGEEYMETLGEAITCCNAALQEWHRETSPFDWAMVLTNKGAMLCELAGLYNPKAAVGMLRDALGCFDDALLEYRREVAPNLWATLQHNKGTTLSALALRLANNEQLATRRAAIACYDAALLERRRDVSPIHWAMTQNNKALELDWIVDLMDGEERAATLQEALSCYDAALSVYTREALPTEHRRIAQQLGMLLFRERDWGRASRYLASALDALDDLFTLDVTTHGRQVELASGGNLTASLAYALVRSGRSAAVLQAAEALERGRARATGEAVARQQAQLAAAQRIAPDLLSQFRQASDRLVPIALTERSTTETLQAGVRDDGIETTTTLESAGLNALNRQLVGYEEAQAARVAYEDLIKRIRQQIPDFLVSGAVFPSGTRDLASDERLVYVASTDAGCAAIMLDSTLSTQIDVQTANALSWWDEQLTIQLVVQLIDRREGAIIARHLLIEQLPAEPKKVDPGDTLKRAMEVLGVANGALAQMSAACYGTNVRRLLMVPCGLLGLLPLHAAIVPTIRGENPEPLLDQVQISYIPSARIWLACRERARVHPSVIEPNALVIGNPLPQPEAPSLPGAEEEARQVSELFRREPHGFIHVFQTEQATREAILEDLKINGNLLSHAHFACHALAELDDPQRSGLFLANGERLMVRDLFDPANQLHFDELQLVTLSACQTGVPGMELPDEVVGLPASWLQAGAARVVASLWPVSDVVTAALMTKFYELHLSDGLDPTDAFWLAQRWLRGLPGWKHDCQTLGASRGAAGPEVSEVVKRLALSGNRASSDNPANTEEIEIGRLDPNSGPVQHWNNPLYWAAFAMYGA